MSSPCSPAPIQGTRGLSPATGALLAALAVRYYFLGRAGRISWLIWGVAAMWALVVLGVARSPRWAVVAGVAVLLLFVVLIPIGLLASTWWSRCRGGVVVGYFDDTATQLVRCRQERWSMGDHFAVHPGRGEATAFRRRIFAHVAGEADRHGATITMTTRVAKLRDRYLSELPGLHVVEFRRGAWLLERTPRNQPG